MIECPYCGGELEEDPEFEDVWTYYSHCKKCNKRFIIRIEKEDEDE